MAVLNLFTVEVTISFNLAMSASFFSTLFARAFTCEDALFGLKGQKEKLEFSSLIISLIRTWNSILKPV